MAPWRPPRGAVGNGGRGTADSRGAAVPRHPPKRSPTARMARSRVAGIRMSITTSGQENAITNYGVAGGWSRLSEGRLKEGRRFGEGPWGPAAAVSHMESFWRGG